MEARNRFAREKELNAPETVSRVIPVVMLLGAPRELPFGNNIPTFIDKIKGEFKDVENEVRR